MNVKADPRRPSRAKKPKPRDDPFLALRPLALPDGRRLYVGNLPYEAKLEHVQDLFVSEGYAMYASFLFLYDNDCLLID